MSNGWMKKQVKGSRLPLMAIVAASLSLLSACDMSALSSGLSKMDGATLRVVKSQLGNSSGGTGLEVFRNAVLGGVMKKAHCTDCHGSLAPQIASTDLNMAYSTSKQRMNFEKVAESSLYIKARNIAHCAPTCVDIGTAPWLEALGAWASAESLAPEPPTGGDGPNVPPVDDGVIYTTTAIQLEGADGARTVPVMVPGTALANVSLRFNLEVSIAGDPNTARISDFKFFNDSGSPIFVQNIRIYQGTTPNLSLADLSGGAGTAYSEVSKVIPTNSSPILSPTQALLSKGQGLYVVFAFGQLEVSQFAGCKSQANFNTLVFATLQNKCFTCHRQGGTGGPAWTMATDQQTLCVQSLQRSNLATPISSTLIQYPFAGQGGHAIRLTTAEKDSFVNWITSEK